jgi:hypothetical protein
MSITNTPRWSPGRGKTVVPSRWQATALWPELRDARTRREREAAAVGPSDDVGESRTVDAEHILNTRSCSLPTHHHRRRKHEAPPRLACNGWRLAATEG